MVLMDWGKNPDWRAVANGIYCLLANYDIVQVCDRLHRRVLPGECQEGDDKGPAAVSEGGQGEVE